LSLSACPADLRNANHLQKTSISRARKKLELLRMFGGDPKAVAREPSGSRRKSAPPPGNTRPRLIKAEGGGDVSAAETAPAAASASVTSVPAEQGAAQATGASEAGEASPAVDILT
jgi:hypothetical protein